MNSTTTRTVARRVAFGASFVTVAGVAAVNSYEHMRDVALLGHQMPVLASTLPLSVDGLLIIASLAMAEDKAQNRHPRTWARLAFWFGAVVSLAANIASTVVHHSDALSIGVAAWPPLALLIVTEIMARPGKAKAEPAAAVVTAPATPVPAVVAVPVVPASVTPVAPVLPTPVAPAAVPAPVAQAQQVFRQTSASLPIPVSPAPAGRGLGRGKAEPMVSPLTGRVLMDAPPKA